MKTTIKLALASLAVSAVVATSVLPAASFAEDAAQDHIVVLQDGTQVKVSGQDVFVIGEDGAQTPAPDGTHTTADGETITTKGGKIVE